MREHLREKLNLSENELKMIQAIELRINNKFSDSDKANGHLKEILYIIHSAFQINKENYVSEIFFEFYILREKTIINLKRIYYELSKLNEFEENSTTEINHLINIYPTFLTPS